MDMLSLRCQIFATQREHFLLLRMSHKTRHPLFLQNKKHEL